MLPVGLEKRVLSDLNELAAKVNSPAAAGQGSSGCGRGLHRDRGLVAPCGRSCRDSGGRRRARAEGAVWLGVWGSNDAVEKASVLIESVASEPQFQF